MSSLGWHVIAGEDLLESLRRCAAGENPDTEYAELWANSEHEHVPPRGEITKRLTPQVLTALRYLADGYRQDETARLMGLSQSAIAMALGRARERTGTKTTMELLARAVRDGALR